MSRKNYNVEETDYRSIKRLSYSSLKLYENDRKAFYKQVILGEQKEEKDSDGIRMGNLIDIKLTDPDSFDKLFHISSAEKPSGQLLIFTDLLLKQTLLDTENNTITTNFIDRATRCYEVLKLQNGGKLRSGINTFIKNFNEEALDYFNECLLSIGKTVVTMEEAQKADAIATSLRNCVSTKDVVSCEGLRKFPIMFNVDDEEFKMEADQICFDHKNKTIYPYDYKVTFSVENFVWEGFLKYSYYIQAALYRYGIMCWKDTVPEYKDYKVENMAFIVADTNNYYQPLLYKTTDWWYNAGWNGFKIGNKHYKGIMSIISDIKESKKSDNWLMSPYNIKKDGKIFIPEFKTIDE